MESFKESGCEFILRENSKFIKLDNTGEYSKVSQFLSCVEGILVIDDKTYFIEVKRYDYFAKKEKLDEKLNKILNKLVDSYFFLIFIDSNNAIFNKINDNLGKQNRLIFLIYICPLYNRNLEKDRKIIATETIRRKLLSKLSNFRNIELLIDTKDNKFELFKKIEG
ncbi:MAG TPA: hypothetical protein ENK22_02265 [Persephonella sp.]|nr:hypothetical protein [Persephonella sp.]